MDKIDLMRKYEQELMEYNKWSGKIPAINFPSEWKVRIIPPKLGAMVRFVVSHVDENKKGHVSVYLDCHDNLGCHGSPYWEAFPTFEYGNSVDDKDIFRCDMKNVDDLIRVITRSLFTQSE